MLTFKETWRWLRSLCRDDSDHCVFYRVIREASFEKRAVSSMRCGSCCQAWGETASSAAQFTIAHLSRNSHSQLVA